MRRAALYICYYNVTEPLVHTQVIAYLRELGKRGVEMHLLTFERERHSAEKKQAIREELAESGIRWHSLRYHERPSLPATLYDIAAGTLKAIRICRKYDIQLVHARSHVPAAMTLILKSLLRCRFLFDLRGLLAEEYVDAGNWKKGRLKFNLTKRMERAFFRKADAFIMLTDRIKQELVLSEPALRDRAADIHVIPCCVETENFMVDNEQLEAFRVARGWIGRLVIVYVGKLGTWYLPEEMVRFFRVTREQDSRFFFQVLTQSDPTPMRQALKEAGISPGDYDIRSVSPVDIPLALAACDAGISFIRPTYSKLASSPTKMGEYLAAGLPVVANTGIGDCDRLLSENRLGTVVCDFSESEFCKAAAELRALLDDPHTSQRCQESARRKLSMSEVGGQRYAAVYETLLGSDVLEQASQATEVA